MASFGFNNRDAANRARSQVTSERTKSGYRYHDITGVTYNPRRKHPYSFSAKVGSLKSARRRRRPSARSEMREQASSPGEAARLRRMYREAERGV